jgi:hypothetical protein
MGVMSEMLGRIAGLDLAGWLPSLSVWSAGAAAALLVVACLLSFRFAGRAGPTGVAARVALVLIGAGAAFIALDGWSRLDLAAERHALEARAQDLLLRAATPGAAFACLDSIAGDAVESACEKAVFQTPEATAAALSYVAAELTLLADFTVHLRRAGSEVPVALADLRRSIEGDRFGLVARVLAVRDGCTPSDCAAFALLADPGRITINLAERSYDLYVGRHATGWPAGGKSPVVSPVAAVTQGVEGEAQPPRASTPRADLFFPSAASIPPVTIMNAEPALPPETTGSTPPSAPNSSTPNSSAPNSSTPKQAPRRPPAGAAASGGNTQPARPPIDLNAASRAGAPASAPQ